MKPITKRTPTERRHTALMADAMVRIEHDVLQTVITAEGIPPDWLEIADRGERSGARTNVHMRLDRDVVRFFKAMGPGYQERMAKVLRVWMHGRLAKVITGPDTTDIVLRPDDAAERARLTTEHILHEEEKARQERERQEESEQLQLDIERALMRAEIENHKADLRASQARTAEMLRKQGK